MNEEIKKINKLIKNKILEEIKKHKKDKELEKKNLECEKNKEKVKNSEKFKEKIKKLKENNEEDELKKINRRNKEFYYLEDLVDVELKEVETSKKIYIDQGKGRLIYALNNDNVNSWRTLERKEDFI